MLSSTMAIDFETAKPNYIKTLLNFKKVVLIGPFQQLKSTVIKTIKDVANVSRLYVINEGFCQNFLQEFPAFKADNWDSHKLEAKDLPILVIDTRDLV